MTLGRGEAGYHCSCHRYVAPVYVTLGYVTVGSVVRTKHSKSDYDIDIILLGWGGRMSIL